MSYRIECVLDCCNHLGEGPLWDVAEGCLYWVDGTGRRVGLPSIWKLNPRSGRTESWSLGRDVGAMALRRQGGAILALDDGFYLFDFAHTSLERIGRTGEAGSRVRLNDGKCDRHGRFFAGGMDDKEELPIACLWRVDPDLSISKVEDGIICANGPCWSPDDRTFYLADTFQEELWAYDYDINTGSIANRRTIAHTRNQAGVFDGSTTDEDGFLWNAELISGDLVRYTPDGLIERRIGMPVRNITSVMFGGANLDEIYVTSMARVEHPAVHDHFAVESKPQFGAGHLFRVTGLGIRGLPEPRFAG